MVVNPLNYICYIPVTLKKQSIEKPTKKYSKTFSYFKDNNIENSYLESIKHDKHCCKNCDRVVNLEVVFCDIDCEASFKIKQMDIQLAEDAKSY